MGKNKSVIFFLLIFFLLATVPVNADTSEYIEAQIKKYSDNVGFVKADKREALKQQFPMCDEFLDVHWFEKQPKKLQRGWRQYTYFDYEYDSNLQQYVEITKKRTVYELVEIQEDGHAEYYGLYFIRRAFPKKWQQVIQDMTITGNNKQFTFHYKSKKYEVSKFGFKMANDYLNICVAKPDKETALFYEMKMANKVLSNEEQNLLVKKINSDGIKFVKKSLDQFVPMDINCDGTFDLQSISRPGGYYSTQNSYFKAYREKYGIPEMKYIFPNNQTCTVSLYKKYLYIYDKCLYFKDIDYKNNITICNLTELTTQKEEGGN